MMKLRAALAGKMPYLVMTIAVIASDQWSKWWAEENLALGSRTVIDGFLDLTLVKNTGVAFGFFPARGEPSGILLLIGMGLVALGVVSVYFLRTPREERLLLSALGLILGGAIGNLADRAAAGGVTDFIDVYYGSYHWHTFNVADSAISVGIALMLVEMIRSRGLEAVPEAEAAPHAEAVRETEEA